MKHCIICNHITIPFWRSVSKDKKFVMHFICHWKLITNQLSDNEVEQFFRKQIPHSKQPMLDGVK